MRKPLILAGVLALVVGIAVVGIVLFFLQQREPPPAPEAPPAPSPTPAQEPSPAPEPEVVAEPAPVVEAATAPEPIAVTATVVGDERGGYCVQLGAFRVPANAERVKAAARAAGFEVAIIEGTLGGEPILRVRTSGQGARGDAQALATAIESKLAIAGWVTRRAR